MSLFAHDAPPAEPKGYRPATFAWVALGLAVLGALAVYLWPRSEEAPAASVSRAKSPSTSAKPVALGAIDVSADVATATVALDGVTLGPAPRLIKDLRAGGHQLRVESPGYQPWEQSTHVVPGVTSKIRVRLSRPPGRLRVESDVVGASVFLDQKFAGRTPLDLTDVTLGPHRITVSADGYDMHAESIDLVPGANTVTVRLKDVRLDEALDVVHRHTLGSCSGRLTATAAGLRYETSNAKDAFAQPLSTIERLEVNYLGKTLTVKVRGGRKYDFGVKDGSADPLLVFQRRVERARERLAAAIP